MEKTFLEKAIESKAEKLLAHEYELFYQMLKKSMFGKIQINGQAFVGDYSETIFPEFISQIKDVSMLQAIEKRRKELIQQETNRVLQGFENIKYLFDAQ